jgi:hypothetical protein
MYYIGLDLHKKSISFCVMDGSGQIHHEGRVGATRWELDVWMKTFPQPWTAAMEATTFTGWIYDHLKPPAAALKASDAARNRGIQEEERPNRRQQDCRLSAMRLPPRVPHGLDGDSRFPSASLLRGSSIAAIAAPAGCDSAAFAFFRVLTRR